MTFSSVMNRFFPLLVGLLFPVGALLLNPEIRTALTENAIEALLLGVLSVSALFTIYGVAVLFYRCLAAASYDMWQRLWFALAMGAWLAFIAMAWKNNGFVFVRYNGALQEHWQSVATMVAAMLLPPFIMFVAFPFLDQGVRKIQDVIDDG